MIYANIVGQNQNIFITSEVHHKPSTILSETWLCLKMYSSVQNTNEYDSKGEQQSRADYNNHSNEDSTFI